METPTKQYTAPYLSVPKLEQVITLLSSRNFTTVNMKTFIPEKFSESDASLAVSALKFLRIINDDGTATESMSKLHLKGDARKKEFEQIVRSAYGKLFGVVEKPQELTQDELTNEMLRQYKLTPRIVRSAVLAFLKLCEYGGLKEEGSIVVKARAPRTTMNTGNGSTRTTSTSISRGNTGRTFTPEGLSEISVVEGKLSIYVLTSEKNKALFDEEAGKDLRTLLAAAKSYAEKRLKEETSP